MAVINQGLQCLVSEDEKLSFLFYLKYKEHADSANSFSYSQLEGLQNFIYFKSWVTLVPGWGSGERGGKIW